MVDKPLPKCKKRSIVAQSRLFTIEQMDLTFSNGVERKYERICHYGQGAVLIVAFTAAQGLLLVKEYAAGTHQYELAFPKGLIEPGEDVLAAANRELQEEVGVAAQKLHYVRELSLAPSYFGARIHLVLAEELFPSRLPGDEPEPIEVLEWPLHQMEDLLNRPDFSEARSIAALFLCKEWLAKNKRGNKNES
ncbi:MAG: ADP compounds hydrolase NudE [Legionellaceae bacterium]|nr:ADP compounds hydrolase NudE [Legionellaceae bacterium]